MAMSRSSSEATARSRAADQDDVSTSTLMLLFRTRLAAGACGALPGFGQPVFGFNLVANALAQPTSPHQIMKGNDGKQHPDDGNGDSGRAERQKADRRGRKTQ